MRKTDKPILDVLHGYEPQRRPVWLMRQAGRYLPEYRELRAKAKNFLNMCLTPDWASKITLQPIRRFDFDAAILFADILLVPLALGQPLNFLEGEGPVLQTQKAEALLTSLSYDASKVAPVFETVRRVKQELPAHTTLIGFCGAPWTVACYMIDGSSKQDFAEAKRWVREQPEQLEKLIAILIDASFDYLAAQIEAGAEALQIFDSWAGLLGGDDFNRWVVAPTRSLVARLKARYPEIPLIGFPREAGEGYARYIRETGVDAMSIDQSVDLAYAKRELQSIKPLQGNLAPEILVQGGQAMLDGLDRIMKTMGRQHILNLGHGVVPQTPPDHVAALVQHIRDYQG